MRRAANCAGRLLGEHNAMNALAAIAAASTPASRSSKASTRSARFENVKRRMEVRGIS